MKVTLRESCGDGSGPKGSATFAASARAIECAAIARTSNASGCLALEITAELQVGDIEPGGIGENQPLVLGRRAQGKLERRDHALALRLVLAGGLLESGKLDDCPILEDGDAANLHASRIARVRTQARDRALAFEVGVELRDRLAARELLARNLQIGFSGKTVDRVGPRD